MGSLMNCGIAFGGVAGAGVGAAISVAHLGACLAAPVTVPMFGFITGLVSPKDVESGLQEVFPGKFQKKELGHLEAAATGAFVASPILLTIPLLAIVGPPVITASFALAGSAIGAFTGSLVEGNEDSWKLIEPYTT